MIPIVDYAEREGRLGAILSRRAVFDPEVEAAAQAIVAAVQARGDEAVLAFTERFDGVRPVPLKVPSSSP